MLNRVLQVKLVKPSQSKTATSNPEEDQNTDTAIIIADVANKVVRKVAMAALAYVVLDTARQVMVAHAYQQ